MRKHFLLLSLMSFGQKVIKTNSLQTDTIISKNINAVYVEILESIRLQYFFYIKN